MKRWIESTKSDAWRVYSVLFILIFVLLFFKDHRPYEVLPIIQKIPMNMDFDRAAPAANASWWRDVQRQITKGEYEIYWNEDANAYQSLNRTRGLRLIYAENGFSVSPWAEEDDWNVTLTLSSYGRSETSRTYRGGKLNVTGCKAHAEGEDVRIEYRNDERGMRQDFIVHHRLPGEGEFRLSLKVAGDLGFRIQPDGKGAAFFDGQDIVQYEYRDMHVYDAEGMELPAWMERQDSEALVLIVDDADAAYPVTVDPLSTSPDWAVSCSQQDAQFGMAVAAAGDIDFDGNDDVIVGAPYYSNGQMHEGAVFVYYGTLGGLSTIPGQILERNIAHALLGDVLSPAGDVNNDGYADIIVGAPGAGMAYVWYGSATGLYPSPNFSASTAEEGDMFGRGVSTAGDVNGDGYDDVIVGAPYYGDNDGGAAFIYYGDETGFAPGGWSYYAYSKPGFDGAHFGQAVSTAGDVNGDGYDDVLIGAWNHNDGVGDAFVFFGSSDGLSYTPDWNAPWHYTDHSSYFARHVSTAGDVNGDGYDDILIGAEYYSARNGAAFVWYGHSWGLSQNAADWSYVADGANYFFGWGISNAGDVNGDGYDDVIVGAPGYGPAGSYSSGRAYVFLGSEDGLSSTPDWTGASGITNAHYGVGVSTAGDINGDGIDDVIVGAPSRWNVQRQEAYTYGRAYAYHGTYDPQAAYRRFRFNDGSVQNWLGYGAYDETGNGPHPHNFTGPEWWDLINYPGGINEDPAGDKNGSMMFSTQGWTVNVPIVNWCVMELRSPNLTGYSEWQNANGFSAEIMEFCSRDEVVIYADLQVTVWDPVNERQIKFNSSATQPLSYSNWVNLSLNWAALPGFPTRCTIRRVSVRLWYRDGDYVEGGIWIDDVLPSIPEPLPAPTSLVALNGYDDVIPLAWQAPEVNGLQKAAGGSHSQVPTLLGYNIYRSTFQAGSYERIAEHVQKLYYRDQPTYPGLWYYYLVSAVYDVGVSEYARTFGRSEEDGYTIHSGWTNAAPTIDGVLSPEEWSGAGTASAVYPGYNGTVTLYAMNDNGYLYLALDDQGDTDLQDSDGLGIFFDDDGNREWPASAGGEEGMCQFYKSSGSPSSRFRGHYGWWPDNLLTEDWVTPTGVTHQISASSGNVQYEVRFDLFSSPMNPSPGDIIGLLVYIWEGGLGDFSGLWPQETVNKLVPLTTGYGWAYGPFSYGDLILAGSPVSGESFTRLDPSSQTIQLTGTGTTDVVISDVGNLGHFEFTIHYDPDVVQVADASDVVLGDFLGSTGRMTYTLGPDIDNGSGKLSFGAVSGGNTAGSDGRGVLATITWTPQAEGTSALDMTDLRVGDVNNIPITSSAMDGSIEVESHFWADIDMDGDVDIFDVMAVALHWNTRVGDEGYEPRYDWDSDGDIDIFDIMAVAQWWNKPIPSGMMLSKNQVSRSVPGQRIRFRHVAENGMDVMEVFAEGAEGIAGFDVELMPLVGSVGISSVQAGDAFSQASRKGLVLGPVFTDEGGVRLGVVSTGEGIGVEGSGVLARIIFSGEPGSISIDEVRCVDGENNVLDAFSVENDFDGYAGERPIRFELYQNSPNPFNSGTKIKFALPEDSYVTLKIYDMMGKEIETLFKGKRRAGEHELVWNGASSPSGVYLYRLEAGNHILTKKLILQK